MPAFLPSLSGEKHLSVWLCLSSPGEVCGETLMLGAPLVNCKLYGLRRIFPQVVWHCTHRWHLGIVTLP